MNAQDFLRKFNIERKLLAYEFQKILGRFSEDDLQDVMALTQELAEINAEEEKMYE